MGTITCYFANAVAAAFAFLFAGTTIVAMTTASLMTACEKPAKSKTQSESCDECSHDILLK